MVRGYIIKRVNYNNGRDKNNHKYKRERNSI
jgi:hypothetical protein